MADISIATAGGLTVEDPCGWGPCSKNDAAEWADTLSSIIAPLRAAMEALQPTSFPPPPQEDVGLGSAGQLGAWKRQWHAQWDAFGRTPRGTLYRQIRAWIPNAVHRVNLAGSVPVRWSWGDTVDGMARLAAAGVGLVKDAMDMDVHIDIPPNVKEAIERAQEEEDEMGFVDKMITLGALAIGGWLFVQYRKDK